MTSTTVRRSLLTSLCVLFLGIAAADAVPLVNHGDTWRYRKGASAPASNWKTVADASLDASWLSGPGGFGYGDGDDATVLSDMLNNNRTVHIRKTFTVATGTLTSTDVVRLRVDYDDAFVAYLDGVEVARSSNAPGAVGAEPAWNATATSTHEASGGSGGQPAEFFTLGTVADLLPAGTHVLAVIGLNESLGSSDLSLIVDLTTEAPPQPIHWTLADSPVTLTSTLSLAAGQTLTIDAGVEVRCPSGVAAIDGAGVIRANGTEAARIRFVPATTGGTWGRITCRGPQESLFSWCDFERAALSGIVQGRNSDVTLEHCRFLNVDVQMVDCINSSLIVRYCEFDSILNNELLHFTTMPANGHALIAYNLFGAPGVPATSGYNDIVDFTGGNRPGPIVSFIGNVFLSAVDDVFDMDSTDAHIEGNIFLNVRKDAARDSSSNAITTGAETSSRSELVVCRNWFWNIEHNLMIKDNGTVLMQNNTTLGITPNTISTNTDAGGNEASGIVLFGEPWRGFPYGNGVLYEGNVVGGITVADPWPILSFAQASTGCFLVRKQNCVQGLPQPGTGNVSTDPLFVGTTGIDASNITQKLALQALSPCRGTGPNGLDMGADVPPGASISGEPSSPTTSRSATLKVAGPGIWAYKWRLNGGPWSDEVSLVPAAIWNGSPLTATMFDAAPPISLSDLAAGPQVVEVLGKNSAGDWQETPTASKTWTVLPTDTDGDGLPDDWETANGLDPADNADATGDLDGDGATNLAEYIAGTDPRDASSRLALAATTGATGTALEFTAVAGKTYQIQFSDDLSASSWQALTTLPAGAAGPRTAQDPTSLARRFYRVVTPAP